MFDSDTFFIIPICSLTWIYAKCDLRLRETCGVGTQAAGYLTEPQQHDVNPRERQTAEMKKTTAKTLTEQIFSKEEHLYFLYLLQFYQLLRSYNCFEILALIFYSL